MALRTSFHDHTLKYSYIAYFLPYNNKIILKVAKSLRDYNKVDVSNMPFRNIHKLPKNYLF